ncbi:MAG: HEAT repeat domain-containing protein [Phycisphaeraceae bacterium]|nr:HEAT repeat domain-containing protein [Phycisphaeraceae bacterium]
MRKIGHATWIVKTLALGVTTAGVVMLGSCGSSSGGGSKTAATNPPAPATRLSTPAHAEQRPTAPAAQAANSPRGGAQASEVRPEQMRERAVDVLLEHARSNVPEQRANAVEALIASPGRLRLVAPEALRDPNPGVRGVAALAVAKASVCTLKEDVRPLLNDPVPQVRAGAILSLWRCRERVDPSPLADMLKSDRPEVRAQAAFVLGEMRESSARQLLADSARDLIKRASPGAQRLLDLQIAEARIKLGDETAITDIRSALFPARNDDLEATALAAQIAGEVQDRWSINPLMYLCTMKDDEGRAMPPEVRLAAAGALARMGVPQGAATASGFLGSPIPVHRAQAAMVLGWSRQSNYLPNIYPLLDDPAPRVRIAAAAAVLNLAGGEGGR